MTARTDNANPWIDDPRPHDAARARLSADPWEQAALTGADGRPEKPARVRPWLSRLVVAAIDLAMPDDHDDIDYDFLNYDDVSYRQWLQVTNRSDNSHSRAEFDSILRERNIW